MIPSASFPRGKSETLEDEISKTSTFAKREKAKRKGMRKWAVLFMILMDWLCGIKFDALACAGDWQGI
jgi:hypothetical protein